MSQALKVALFGVFTEVAQHSSPTVFRHLHRAVWVDLTGDGRMSILTSRAKLRRSNKTNGNTSTDEASRPKNGQLVWLEMPSPFQFDKETGTPLEEDGTPFDPFSARHLPWREQ